SPRRRVCPHAMVGGEAARGARRTVGAHVRAALGRCRPHPLAGVAAVRGAVACHRLVDLAGLRRLDLAHGGGYVAGRAPRVDTLRVSPAPLVAALPSGYPGGALGGLSAPWSPPRAPRRPASAGGDPDHVAVHHRAVLRHLSPVPGCALAWRTCRHHVWIPLLRVDSLVQPPSRAAHCAGSLVAPLPPAAPLRVAPSAFRHLQPIVGRRLWHLPCAALGTSRAIGGCGVTDADIVIVGAGLAGLSTAVHLLERGPADRHLTLVDPRTDFGRDRTWCSWALEPHPFE